MRNHVTRTTSTTVTVFSILSMILATMWYITTSAQTAMQQAAGAAMYLSYVIPAYCFARLIYILSNSGDKE